MVVRWYCSLPLSAAQMVRLLAQRNIDGSARTVLSWVQTFGPELAAALRGYRRRKFIVKHKRCKMLCGARRLN